MGHVLGYSDIAFAADSLVRKNIPVTQRNTRKEMGNRGSFKTIQIHLSEWKKNRIMSTTGSVVSSVFPSNSDVHQSIVKLEAKIDEQFSEIKNIRKELYSLNQLLKQMDMERENDLVEFQRCTALDVENARLKEKEHYMVDIDLLIKDKNVLLGENSDLKNKIDEMLPGIQQADSVTREVKILRMKVDKYEDYMRQFVAGHPEFEPDWAHVLFTPPPPPKKGI
jgi:seryl-tRNA synthetase